MTGPMSTKTFVLDSLSRMALSFLGIPDHGGPASKKTVRHR